MKNNLNPAGWTRLVLYVISALVGVGAVVATTLGYGEVAATLGTLAGAGAAVTGGTAVANLPKAPDQTPLSGYDLTAIAPALEAIVAALEWEEHADHTHEDVQAALDTLGKHHKEE